MAYKNIVIFQLLIAIISAKANLKNSVLPEVLKSQDRYSTNLATAVFDVVEGFPSEQITVCYENHTELDFIENLLLKFLRKNIAIRHFYINSTDVQEKYFDFLSYQVSNYLSTITIFFGKSKLFEHLLLEIRARNFIRRNFIYIFYWGMEPFDRYFVRNIHYPIKVYVLSQRQQNISKNDTFRLFYSQSTSHREHHLEKINWWKEEVGLFHHPTLPRKKSVYKDFKGKIFHIPVIHKPPWHFVTFHNGSMNVSGGRDDRILTLLSKKLNFVYKYFDPPQRIQGTAPSENGEFNGVLGLIWQRKVEFFIGDVALTYERSNYVEFSFVTLADSGAFVTHAPSRLNEALALLRPFQWQVWPAIGLTFLIVGPVLYVIIALPNAWRPRFSVRSHARLFFDCTWFTITILLKQTGKEPSSSHNARFFIILLSISATYVINDMYSANLTSLLARPGREKAINNLYQLEYAMINRGYKLFVERHSSSFGLLENGSGIYGRLWELMQKKQSTYLIDSVEEGVKLVKETTNVAVLAGRETLYFDSQRFGNNYFQLSDKLNTAYSAIAFQLGCPYIEEINKILMAIFEAGIITKMTENEYEELGKSKKVNDVSKNAKSDDKKETRRVAKAIEDNEKLKPISLKMLQGAFYLLCIGNVFAGFILFLEILSVRHYRCYLQTKDKMQVQFKKYCRKCGYLKHKVVTSLRNIYRNIMYDAFVATLDYLE